MAKRQRSTILLVWAVLLLVTLAGGMAWFRHTRPEARLLRGREALRHDDWEQAESLIADLEASGQLDQAHLLRGEVLYRRHEYDQAISELEKIQDQGALRLEAAALVGQCLVYLNNPREAERVLSFVLEEQPGHLDAHRALAALYYDQGALLRAVAHLQRVAELDPNDGRPWRLIGLIHHDLGDFTDRTVNAYREALRRDLTTQVANEVRQELLDCLIQRSRYEDALAVLADCPPSLARTPALLAQRTECLWVLGEVAEAKALAERSLRAHPGSRDLRRIQARLHLAANEAREAAALLEKVLEGDPHDFSSRTRLAEAYLLLGRKDDATRERSKVQETQAIYAELTSLNAAADREPWNAEVRKRMAILCGKLDKPELEAMWLRAVAACAAPK